MIPRPTKGTCAGYQPPACAAPSPAYNLTPPPVLLEAYERVGVLVADLGPGSVGYVVSPTDDFAVMLVGAWSRARAAEVCRLESAHRIARRLETEQPPSGMAFCLLVVEGRGISLQAVEVAPAINAKGGVA